MKKILFVTIVFLTLVAIGISTGWFGDHPELMTGLAVAGVFLVLLAGLVVGSMYSAWLIRLGGRIATDSQQANAGMGTSYVNLARDMLKQVGRDRTPALPLPSQTIEGDWLPLLSEFEQEEESQERG